MKKIFLSLLLFTLSLFTFGQSYKGDFNLNVHFMGLSASTSHGVMFSNDYLGLGAEAGGVSVIGILNRGWYAAYADYRHFFNVGSKGHSIFVQAAPGVGYSGSSTFAWFFPIPDFKGGATIPSSEEAEKVLFYAKAGTGWRWQWKKVGLDLGLYANFFTPTSNYSIIPSVGVTFHW